MVDNQDQAERALELAKNEEISVLHSALYSAMEAELSSLGWPRNSKEHLDAAFEELDG
jgi:hypothetical protein